MGWLVEVILLFVAAPPIYFPGAFPHWARYIALGLLPISVLWRRWRMGSWHTHTVADVPLAVLAGICLPMAVWVAPDDLRAIYSTPRAFILLWNMLLFVSIVAHASRSRTHFYVAVGGLIAAAAFIASVTLIGAEWPNKIPGVGRFMRALPTNWVAMRIGADSSISANQVSGSLLYALPLALWLCVGLWPLAKQYKWTYALLVACTALTAGVFFVAQSRSGFVGLMVGIVVVILLGRRWGQWVVGAGIAGASAALMLAPALWLVDWGAWLAGVESTTGSLSLAVRMEIWSRAWLGIQDFTFTGMGLGTFREVVHTLYPFMSETRTIDIAHAHNFFLQSTLDFGVVGLACVLALYGIALWQCARLMRGNLLIGGRVWAYGFQVTLIAQAIYSLTDAVAMGAKTNFLFWYLLALIVATIPFAERVSPLTDA